MRRERQRECTYGTWPASFASRCVIINL